MDDRALLVFVRVLLLDEQPEELREPLTRLCELLEREIAKRRRGRPKDDTGSLVATISGLPGKDLATAKRLVAKMTKKKLRTVARAHQRHQNQRRQK